MHTFLVFCVLIEGAFIAFLLRQSRRLSQGVDSLSERMDTLTDAAQLRMAESESKISDLSEECARIDTDLSTFATDLEELGNLRRNDAKELGDRLTQLAEEVEKSKRRSARPAATGNSFDAVRNTAEKFARRQDPDRDRLVALAEG